MVSSANDRSADDHPIEFPTPEIARMIADVHERDGGTRRHQQIRHGSRDLCRLAVRRGVSDENSAGSHTPSQEVMTPEYALVAYRTVSGTPVRRPGFYRSNRTSTS